MVTVRVKRVLPHSVYAYEMVSIVDEDKSSLYDTTELSELMETTSSPSQPTQTLASFNQDGDTMNNDSLLGNSSDEVANYDFLQFLKSKSSEGETEEEISSPNKRQKLESANLEPTRRSNRLTTRTNEDEQQPQEEAAQPIVNTAEFQPQQLPVINTSLPPALAPFPITPFQSHIPMPLPVPAIPVQAPVPTPAPAPARAPAKPRTKRRSVNHKHMRILTPEQRDTLKDISAQEIMKDMAFYMQHVLGNSRENIKNVMNKVMMLVNGYGVRHQSSMREGNVFRKGVMITLDHDFAAMDIEANDWVHAHGGDVSHGWLIKLPLRKMWVYQVARFERGGPFLDPNAMPEVLNNSFYRPRSAPPKPRQTKNSFAKKQKRELASIPDVLPPPENIGTYTFSTIPELLTTTTNLPYEIPTTSTSNEGLQNDFNAQFTDFGNEDSMPFEVSNTAEV